MIILTRQEAFDKAARGIIAQGKKSFNPKTGFCVYRARDGCKCAVGHLIPDDVPDESIGLGSIYLGNVVDHLFEAEMLGFLKHLQEAHDLCEDESGDEFLSEYRLNMVDVAKKYELDSSVLYERGVA